MKRFWHCLGLILGLSPLGTGCGVSVEEASTEEISSRTSTLTAFSTQQAIAAGQNHSFALRSNGQVLAWGQNTYGQLGDGTTTTRTAPVPVAGLPPARSIAAGLSHSLAVSGDGIAYAWGQNNTGQLGDGTLNNRTTPVQVVIPGNVTVTAVAAGLSHSLALTTDGKVWAWGQNANAQIGDGTTGGTRTTPVQVNIPGGAVAIAAGWYHSLALSADGKVWVWGRNNTGQVGNGGTTNQTTPFAVTLTGTASGIAGGGAHSLARTADGKVWAWGQNTFGQLGDGTSTTRFTPVQVPSLSNIASIAAGGYFSLAVGTDGKGWAWGQNNMGQVGNGATSTTGVITPVAVMDLTDATAVSGGTLHALALRPGCPVWAWGSNTYGQLGDGTTTNRLAPTQAQLFNTFFMDLEGDGFGNPDPLLGVEGCLPPPGYVDNALDCDDYDPFINPNAQEVCNGLDDNCADGPDEGNPNGGDSCSTGDPGVCGAGTMVCAGGTLVCTGTAPASTEICDSLDNDCDGLVDEDNPGGLQQCWTGLLGVCGEGVTYCSAGEVVCVQVHAPSTEVCDDKDNDCDGAVNEEATLLFFRDADGDGYGTPNSTLTSCAPPAGYVSNSNDCNDNNASIKPGAAEVCDGVDNNCAGGVDEGDPGGGASCDPGCGWGYTVCSGGRLTCVLEAVPIEECGNWEDDDCDGQVDEGCPSPCFVAGTAITLADGSTKPIEDMVIGDQVLAYDVEARQVVPAPVTQTFVHENSSGILLINGRVQATANHPFYANGRWVRADELEIGDELVMLNVSDGADLASTHPVRVTSLLMQPQHETTYNLEVDTHHDYFAEGILVHNKEAPPFTCGNGSCDDGESKRNCPSDCPY
ncbi:MopE-related protein [Archangium lansingense]|uniref:RCC1 domain-containing protein n=1 Tax=Archangium lansingense TaxID=2995310 RepID=UPI003B7D87F9